MFADTIRSANTEHEIYYLLTSYIETVRFSDHSRNCIPEPITRLPLNGIGDVRGRFEQLLVELDKASKSLDDQSCATIKEGVHALGVALSRLTVLDERYGRPPH
jgi:hypothetical protein